MFRGFVDCSIVVVIGQCVDAGRAIDGFPAAKAALPDDEGFVHPMLAVLNAMVVVFDLPRAHAFVYDAERVIEGEYGRIGHTFRGKCRYFGFAHVVEENPFGHRSERVSADDDAGTVVAEQLKCHRMV